MRCRPSGPRQLLSCQKTRRCKNCEYEAHGADVVLYTDTTKAAKTSGLLAAETGAELIKPYDDARYRWTRNSWLGMRAGDGATFSQTR